MKRMIALPIVITAFALFGVSWAAPSDSHRTLLAEAPRQPGQSTPAGVEKTPDKSKKLPGSDVTPPKKGEATPTAKKKKKTPSEPPRSQAEKRLEQHHKDMTKNWKAE